MKIRISDIPPRGLKVNDTLPLDGLNHRMRQGQDQDIIFLADPEVELTIFKTPGGANARGFVRTRYRQSCSRCLEPVERDLEVEVSLVLQHTAERDSRNAASSEEPALEDIGIVFFDQETVDLEDVLQENLILALCRFWHPPLKADGSCSLCGLKFEDTLAQHSDSKFSLGAVLKEAGLKNFKN